jgi:hypothetical protein
MLKRSYLLILSVAALALVLLPAALGASASSAAEPVLRFDGYGSVRLGDTPGEVEDKLGSMECHYLGGPCVCSTLGEGRSSIVFVYMLDGAPGLDLVFTYSQQVVATGGLQIGDSLARLRKLFPHAHDVGRRGYSDDRSFVVGLGRLGILAEIHRGHVVSLIAGKRRFFDYVEFCS